MEVGLALLSSLSATASRSPSVCEVSSPVYQRRRSTPPSGEAARATLKLWLPPAHFGVLMPVDQQPNKRVPELVRVIKLAYREEPELLLRNEGRRWGDMENTLGTQGTLPGNLECFRDR